MGLPFPVYSQDELRGMSTDKRAALKAAIKNALANDPDVARVLGPILPELRAELHDKTNPIFDSLKRNL
jgi:hypothetical protein